MYISELRLTREDYWKIRRENNNVFDVYTVHKLVYSLFPKKENSANEFLYMDTDMRGTSREKQILLVSNVEPQSLPLGRLSCEELPEGFLEQEMYGFEIIANPVKRDAKSGKLQAIRSNNPAEQANWFCAKAEKSGFKVEAGSLSIGHTDVLSFDKDGMSVTIARTQFTGRLRVTERQLFKKTFCQGFGRGKAFGCGLLRIVPLKPASVDA